MRLWFFISFQPEPYKEKNTNNITEICQNNCNDKYSTKIRRAITKADKGETRVYDALRNELQWLAKPTQLDAVYIKEALRNANVLKRRSSCTKNWVHKKWSPRNQIFGLRIRISAENVHRIRLKSTVIKNFKFLYNLPRCSSRVSAKLRNINARCMFKTYLRASCGKMKTSSTQTVALWPHEYWRKVRDHHRCYLL